jgi:hypothetical protein
MGVREWQDNGPSLNAQQWGKAGADLSPGE